MRKIVILGGLLFVALFLTGCVNKDMTCGLKDGKTTITQADALKIVQASECAKEGLKTNWSCNENTGTWWVDLKTKKEGCSPACVVDVEKKTAEINWKCTGLKK